MQEVHEVQEVHEDIPEAAGQNCYERKAGNPGAPPEDTRTTGPVSQEPPLLHVPSRRLGTRRGGVRPTQNRPQGARPNIELASN